MEGFGGCTETWSCAVPADYLGRYLGRYLHAYLNIHRAVRSLVLCVRTKAPLAVSIVHGEGLMGRRAHGNQGTSVADGCYSRHRVPVPANRAAQAPRGTLDIGEALASPFSLDNNILLARPPVGERRQHPVSLVPLRLPPPYPHPSQYRRRQAASLVHHFPFPSSIIAGQRPRRPHSSTSFLGDA